MSDKEINDLFNQLKQLHIKETLLKEQIHKKIIESRKDTTKAENKKLKEHNLNRKHIQFDRFGKDIVLNKTAVLLTKGKSKIHRGKVVKISKTRTTIVDRRGRLYWRAHNNIQIED